MIMIILVVSPIHVNGIQNNAKEFIEDISSPLSSAYFATQIFNAHNLENQLPLFRNQKGGNVLSKSVKCPPGFECEMTVAGMEPASKRQRSSVDEITPVNNSRPPWIYDAKQLADTPSRKAGIAEQTETRYRRDGVELIVNVGTALNLQRNPTMGTAAVFYHRFFMHHSFNEFNRHIVALAALFLAGKVEETPKKCKDIVKTSQEHLKDDQIARMGKYPVDEVMAAELVLLRTLKMDLQLELPYKFLFQFAKHNILGVPKELLRTIVQSAHTFMNDSLITTLVLECEPEIIAVALLHMAAHMAGVEIGDWPNKGTTGLKNEKWYDLIVDGLTEPTLEAICHKVLDIYPERDVVVSKEQTNDSTPTTAVPCTPPSMSATASPSINPINSVPASVSKPPPPMARPPTASTSGALHPVTSLPNMPPHQATVSAQGGYAPAPPVNSGGQQLAPPPRPPHAQTMATYAVNPRAAAVAHQAYATPLHQMHSGPPPGQHPYPQQYGGMPPNHFYGMPPTAPPVYGAAYPGPGQPHGVGMVPRSYPPQHAPRYNR